MESECGPSTPQQVATVLRIRRKRTADPHEALVVSVKKPRHDPADGSPCVTALLYSLAGTSAAPELSAVDGLPSFANVIDFDPHETNEKMEEQMATGEEKPISDTLQYLNTFCDAIDEGGTQQTHSSTETSQITLNGVPMVTVKTSELQPEAEYVFDFYWNPAAVACNPDDLEVRLANQEDIEFYNGEDTESSIGADDEDDSNDENNWRNDYPDDEEDSEDSDEERDSDFDDLNERFDECELCSSDKEYDNE
ncbi:hypothetical protein Tcan_06306 [Toxocara canis]|uniref:Probable RNA polymerase II nuclear localization protein SLC7A6OS n=1 Tax=Toxocara canis TaxID=6265 RepID=A0A0B2W5V1_TOXCA|nr:hypothetical protein Tcan_06306 [Toxocara canis]